MCVDQADCCVEGSIGEITAFHLVMTWCPRVIGNIVCKTSTCESKGSEVVVIHYYRPYLLQYYAEWNWYLI